MSDTAISSYTSSMLPSSNYSYSQQQDQLQHLQDQKSRLNSSEDQQFHSEMDLEDSSSQQSSSSKKKKKATRACFHCQKVIGGTS